MPNHGKEKETGQNDVRTPRRVQWASKNRIEHFEQVPLENEDSHSKELDEYGRNPAAFAELHQALESYLQEPSISKPAPRAKNIPRLKKARFGGQGEHKAESSRQGALRDTTSQSISEDVYLDPAEMAGMPLPLSPSGLSRLHERKSDDTVVEEYEMKEKSHWAKKASQMVQACTMRRNGHEPRVSRLRGRLPPLASSLKKQEKQRERERDVEAGAHVHVDSLPLGPDQGVLSTLLSLYQRQTPPNTSSTDLTENDTDQGSMTSLRSHEAEVDSLSSEAVEPQTPSYFGTETPLAEEPQTGPAERNVYTCPRHKRKLQISRPSSTSSLSLPPSRASSAPLKAAQSSAGVVGALIATANNLSGPAAPLHSSIGPNVTRSGYRLSRYKLEPEASPLPRSGSTTPCSTPTSDSGKTVLSQTPSIRRAKKPTWLTEVKPAARVSNEAEKRAPAYEASSKAYEEGKEHGVSYRKAKKNRRKMAEIYITKHVAEVLQRQEFLLKLARALLMFAGPGHRLQSQLRATARVLDIELSILLLPNVILISFGDPATSTSNVKFIQQVGALDLEKLLLTHRLYWKVIHDEISVSSASASLDLLMHSPSRYNGWQIVLFGGLCSSAICSLSFSGSFVDSIIVFPLGALLVIVQMVSVKNELYSNVFEITIATLLSFISAAIATSRMFCYAAIASSSVVLILPGFLVLTGSLELAARQIVSGAVRICFAVIYSLFLGFGLAMGAQIYSRITGLEVVGPDDYTCGTAHQPTDPWWQRRVSLWWAFLTVPLFSLVLSLRNQAPMWRKEMIVTVLIACGGWAANHFSGYVFKNRPDIQPAIGALVVGLVANFYGRFFYGNAYVVMITGILFQLPSGLADGGLLTFATDDNKGAQFHSYEAGFRVAIQLIAVAIGLTVGLFMSVVIVHPFGGGRRREGGLFSL